MTPRKAMIGSRFLLPNGIYSIYPFWELREARQNPETTHPRGLLPVSPNTPILGDSGSTGSKRKCGDSFSRGCADD